VGKRQRLLLALKKPSSHVILSGAKNLKQAPDRSGSFWILRSAQNDMPEFFRLDSSLRSE